MSCLYVYFATQVSTAVESAQQAAESTATTAVESAVGAVASVAGPLHAANVTINASAKINFFIVLFLFYDVLFCLWLLRSTNL